ncbi:MAG: polyphosphate polymerase domain-containing protein [Erysipelotrichaceae bacterium]|nr:polyphosphate polymerase domain-containing protein [Erysipelotrichaceae bacterium]
MNETFQRSEKKYLLSMDQYETILHLLERYIQPDHYHHSDLRSIYYDTDRYELIRRSIEKPLYKEKLRIRSYGNLKEDDLVYVEFKKKYDGIVYKRRTKTPYGQALKDIYGSDFLDSQVGNEIRYALQHYDPLSPKIYIGTSRSSFIGKENEKLRITFDTDIRYRMKNLSLEKKLEDKLLTDQIVMELKIPEAMPLWLSSILDEVHAYPRGFSKVGTAFLKEIKGE